MNEDHLDRYIDDEPELVILKASGHDRSLYVVGEDNVLRFRRDIPPNEGELWENFQTQSILIILMVVFPDGPWPVVVCSLLRFSCQNWP